jgi:hypothetical protein
VPEDVIGLPEMLKILGTVAATLVTVPDPAPLNKSIIVPLAFLTYIFLSTLLIAISPTAKSPLTGTAAAVSDLLGFIIVIIPVFLNYI